MREELSRAQMHKAIDSTLSGLNSDPWLFHRISVRAAEGETKVKKKLSVGFILAIALLAIAAAAFALTRGFGLLDFWQSSWGNSEIPADVEKYIERDMAMDETEHFTVRFRESTYDGKTCHIVYEVVPRSRDLLLFGGFLDETWYGLTHLNPDREKIMEDGRTVLDRWNEGGYTSGWIVDEDVGSDEEDIDEYSSVQGVLDEETGIYTGQISILFDHLKEERTLRFCVRMVPLKNMQDEESMDYDHAEEGVMERTFHAVVSGEEVILVNTSPVLFPAIGVQVDQVRLMVLPQEIQYQIDYSVTDSALYHSLFDEHHDDDRTMTIHPFFQFVTDDPEGGKPEILPRGITDIFTGYDIDEEKGLYRQTGSLGRSCFADTYTLGAYRAIYVNSSEPMETVSFQVNAENP